MDEFTKRALAAGKPVGCQLRCLGCDHEFVLKRDNPAVLADPDTVQCPECQTYKCVANMNFFFEPGTKIWTCIDCDSTVMQITAEGTTLCMRCGNTWTREERNADS